jgi:hypothetical protein
LSALDASNPLRKAGAAMHDWTFSATAEWVVGLLLGLTVVALTLV